MQFPHVPKELKYYLNRFSKFKRVGVQLKPSGGVLSALPGNGKIQLAIPSDGNYDADTFNMHFLLTTMTGTQVYNGGVVTGTAAGCALPPRNIECIIGTLNLAYAGMQNLDDIHEYGRLYNAVMDHTAGTDADTKRSIMSWGGNALQEAITNNAANLLNRRFSITNWLGFIGSCEPRMLDTSLYSTLRLTLTLASNDILATTAVGSPAVAPTNPNYRLDDIYFTMDQVFLLDNELSLGIQSHLLTKGPVNIPYKTWRMFQGPVSGPTSTTVVDITSKSLNHIVSFFSPVAGYTALTSNNITYINDAGTSSYFWRPLVTNTSAIANANYASGINMQINSLQYRIGGQYYPAYVLPTDVLFTFNLDSLKSNRDLLGGVSLFIENNVQYLNSFASFWQRMNYNDDTRWMTGMNTNGNTQNINIEYKGTTLTLPAGVALNHFVFVEQLNSFVVGAGKNADLDS
ncbi:hypothetical protein M569_17602 [Genlisea aurea]|uniref:Uncharacterized protein n=1 Tax=Genlisea aurea TaxID=192259 RepID=S8DCX7_9LAMI|nr:hypothetical protein M569_17602 [Genlisea aurea]